MSGLIAKLLRQNGWVQGATMEATEKSALVDTILAQAEVAGEQNKDYARQLERQLAGNHAVKLSDRPDGSGFFYGDFRDESDTHYRVDVMPPRPLWSGDFGGEAADPEQWIVYVNGEEVERAPSIRALSVLLTKRVE